MNETLHELLRYNAWATKALIAACRDLDAGQLDSPAGGYGSIIATFNHVVTCDANYAAMLTGPRLAWAADGGATDDLEQLEERVNETTRLWGRLLSEPVDGERMLSLDEGQYECHAAVVLAQALHHGSAHREQIRVGLKALGVELKDVQPWHYALATGRAHSQRQQG